MYDTTKHDLFFEMNSEFYHQPCHDLVMKMMICLQIEDHLYTINIRSYTFVCWE